MNGGGVQIDVRSDIERVVAEFSATTSEVATATYRALNRALDKSATETSREIRQVYNIRHKAALAAMKKRRANKKSLLARLRIEGARIPLIEFDARWSRRQPGASVKIKVGGARKTVAGTFIAAATANNYRGGGSMGMNQVFRRVGRARLPIRSLRSLSLPQMFANRAVLAAVQVIAAETFSKNFEQQLTFLTGVR